MLKKVLLVSVLSLGMSFALQSYSEVLVTPGVTAKMNVYDNDQHGFQYVVTNISTNVVVRPEGSIDGTNWFNLDDSDADLTITSNTTKFDFKQATFSQVRVRYVSKSGNGGTVSVFYKGLRKL